MNKVTNLKDYAKLCLHALITGVIIGAIVGVYQLGIQWLSSTSQKMYGSDKWWIIALIIVISIGAAFLNELILRLSPSVDGSGIPNIELGIRKHREINWKRDILLMITNSYLSTFAGFPLGSEGPSVVIGGKVSKMVQDVTKTGNDDSVAMACGTGFGCAFLSPLAGLCYIFEESLHKFNPALIFRALIMICSAVATTCLINHHRLLEVENVVTLQLDQLYVLLLLVIVNTIVGILFVKAIVWLKKLFTKLAHNKFVKYRGFFLYGLIIILNVFCVGFMGAGSTLVHNLANYTSLWIIGLILLFRFIITVISGTGKVTGGLVVPMMTLGAICGQFVASLCNQYFMLPVEVNEVIILVSMCMIFGVITKTPVTSIVLVYSALADSSGDYLHALINMPAIGVAIVLAFFISKWLKVDCLYEQFMDIALENEEKQAIEAK